MGTEMAIPETAVEVMETAGITTMGTGTTEATIMATVTVGTGTTIMSPVGVVMGTKGMVILVLATMGMAMATTRITGMAIMVMRMEAATVMALGIKELMEMGTPAIETLAVAAMETATDQTAAITGILATRSLVTF